MSVYLDYNATAPLRPEILQALNCLSGQPANPSSVHAFGRQARAWMDEARLKLARYLRVSPHELIFTSGGTEANNLVLVNFDHVITSQIEHDAVLAACKDADFVAVNADGQICLDRLESALRQAADKGRSSLVSVMAANNETGVIQPLSKVAELARTYGAFFHSDMVQFLGKAECDLSKTNLDFASFSAHKIGGPSGIGVLWCRSGRQLQSLLKGGGQEQGRRSGTENLAGIIGFGMAVELTDHSQLQRQGQWRDGAEAQIKAACPDVRVIGAEAERLANTSALYLPFVSAQTAVMKLDLAGFCVSAGSACSSGKVKKSHVIEAMGYADAASNVIRLSGGWKTDKEDWAGVAEAIIALYKQGR